MKAGDKIDFAGRTWNAHRQDHWLEFAGNTNFPDYLRIVFVAYGRHKANGHARLERGELARYLVRRNGTLPERRVIWDAIQSAVSLGYLATDSRQLCLVVSSDHSQGGEGDPDEPCQRDHTRRRESAKNTKVRNDTGRFGSNVRNGARRSSLNVRNDTGPSEVNVGNETGRSTLNPSICISSPGASAPDTPQERRAS